MKTTQSKYIPRHIELIIAECLEQFPVVLVTGPRQVGKTTTLQKTCTHHNYTTLDDPIVLQEAKHESRLFLKNNRPPLLIDEVQYAPELFRYIKMMVDTEQNSGSFVLTGSQAFELMQGVSETLAGRMAIIELQGLSLREIYRVPYYAPYIPTESYIQSRKKHLVPYTNLWEHMHRGSMPRVVAQHVHWDRYYGGYLKTYIERDIRQIIQITDESKFLAFLTAMAARCGELLNYSTIAQHVEVSVDTIKRWVSVLKTSGIIFLLEPYTNNLLKRVIKTPKLYFYDTGLASYLARWNTPETLRNGAQAGNLFENFVISEIRKSYINAGVSLNSLYFYRDKDGKEIDLLIDQDGTLYPVEIKMTGNPNRSMVQAFSVLDSVAGKKRGPGALLCQTDRAVFLQEDVMALPVEYV